MNKCTESKEKKLIALKKAKSLTEKVILMVEGDRYCVDIMQQNLAIIGLLRSVHQLLMENHLNTCFKAGMESKSEDRKKKMIDEISHVISLYNRQK
jgi:DNA-binding FrmR family transcriptional regulator